MGAQLGSEEIQFQAGAFAGWFLRQRDYETTSAAFFAWAVSKDFALTDRAAVLLAAQGVLYGGTEA